LFVAYVEAAFDAEKRAQQAPQNKYHCDVPVIRKDTAMTIDERLDRLTERHEALAQSVELLTADVRQLTVNVDRLAEKVDKMSGMMENLMTGFGAIAELVRRHEARLDGLEGA
jgi:predicted RNase H-like nuclease (RuvC/YqgF family)